MDPDLTDDEAAALLRAVVRLCDCWGLSQVERITLVVRDDLGGILAIHSALRVLFPDSNQGYRWMRQPNSAFGGLSALEVILREASGIERVRAYLDAEIHG